MAEQIAHDVVKEAQSVGDASPIDVPAKTSNVAPAGNGQAHQPIVNFNAQQDLAADGSEERVQADAQVNVAEPTDIPIDETEIQSVVADASGGSDTDTSKETKGTAAGHVRSNSVKKPASFKSVSVTKNFLAKTVTAPAPKIGDKGEPSLPRLHWALQLVDQSLICQVCRRPYPKLLPSKPLDLALSQSRPWADSPEPRKQTVPHRMLARCGIRIDVRLPTL